MKRRPDCKSALFAVVFGIVGGVFLAVGLVLLSAGAGGTAALILFEAGVLFLMAFGFCLMWADLLHRRWDKLRWKGKAAEGRVTEVTHYPHMTWIGGGSPWSVLCKYQWEGKEYTVRSGLLWADPRPVGPVTVYVDPGSPKRAWADVSTLPEEAV